MVNAKHSEKPSVSRLTDAIRDSLERYIDTFALILNIPDDLVSDVISMWTFNQGHKTLFQPCANLYE